MTESSDYLLVDVKMEEQIIRGRESIQKRFVDWDQSRELIFVILAIKHEVYKRSQDMKVSTKWGRLALELCNHSKFVDLNLDTNEIQEALRKKLVRLKGTVEKKYELYNLLKVHPSTLPSDAPEIEQLLYKIIVDETQSQKRKLFMDDNELHGRSFKSSVKFSNNQNEISFDESMTTTPNRFDELELIRKQHMLQDVSGSDDCYSHQQRKEMALLDIEIREREFELTRKKELHELEMEQKRQKMENELLIDQQRIECEKLKTEAAAASAEIQKMILECTKDQFSKF